jgi:hypothetical protein
MIKRRHFIFNFIAIGFASMSCLAGSTLKPHVHGNARITIALESATSGTIDLDAPGDSIIGFERPASTAGDQKIVDKAFLILRKGTALVQFDPTLGCEVKTKQVGFEKAEEGSHHQDINASYEVSCKKSLSQSFARVGIMKAFPRVKKVTVEVLSESNQFEKTFETDGQQVQFP